MKPLEIDWQKLIEFISAVDNNPTQSICSRIKTVASMEKQQFDYTRPFKIDRKNLVDFLFSVDN